MVAARIFLCTFGRALTDPFHATPNTSLLQALRSHDTKQLAEAFCMLIIYIIFTIHLLVYNFTTLKKRIRLNDNLDRNYQEQVVSQKYLNRLLLMTPKKQFKIYQGERLRRARGYISYTTRAQMLYYVACETQ